jgi:hypothetical protein
LPVSKNATMGIYSLGAEVFANGKLIQPEGPHGDDPQRYQEISRIYDLKLDPSVTDLTLAVRTTYLPFGFGAYTSFFASRRFRLGNREELDRSLELWSVHGLFERLPRLVYSILLIVLALFLLALYFSQRGHTEYLWLALYELVQAPIGFVELAGSYARMDQLLFGSVSLQLLLISAYLYFEFLVAFLSLRRRWYIRLLRYAAPLLAGVGPALLMVGRGSHVISQQVIFIALVFFGLASSMWMIGWLLFVFITLIAATLRRNFEAGLLLLPLLLSLGGLLELILSASMSDSGGHSYRSPLSFQAGPIPIHVASIADFVGILAIVLIIFFRLRRIGGRAQRAGDDDSTGEAADAGLRGGLGLQPGQRSGRRFLSCAIHERWRAAGRYRRRGRQGTEGRHECLNAAGGPAQYAGAQPGKDSRIAQPRAGGRRQLHHLPGRPVWRRWRAGVGQRRPPAALPE